jgi:glycosyltransferase involved in cell wall biosynthesis
MISIVTPCFNEQDNVEALHSQIVEVMSGYEFEHIYIDNASTDHTVQILRRMAEQDSRIKVIVNTRNFGYIRSSFHGILQARGDAVICMASDLQDPPSLIKDFIKKWQEGWKVVVGVKSSSEENPIVYAIRSMYYRTLDKLANIHLIEHFTGFGLYDREVVEVLRKIDDPYPYLRGLIADIGFENTKVEFKQPKRKCGNSHSDLYTLFDTAMLGLTNNTKVPLRLATIAGFFIASLSFLVGLFYLIYKLAYWRDFEIGLAPLVVGFFFLGGIQLFFMGIIGEYVGAIHTQVQHRPLVIEKERVNFEK